MSVEKVIMLVCEPEKDDYVAKAAAAIRKVVQCLKDAWPPQPSGLESEKFKIPSKADKFLTCLLIVKGENETSSRSARLRHSLAQDIVYIVTSGRVKRPKRLLLPSFIKIVTNSTELQISSGVWDIVFRTRF